MTQHNGTANMTNCIIISAFGILLNGSEVIILLYEKRTKVPFDISLLSLAFSDLIVSFCLIAYFLQLPDLFEQIFRHLIFTLGFLSALHLMFIAIQRLIAVRLPFKAAILLTRKRCFIVVASLWIASLTISLPIILRNDTYYRVYLCTPLVFGCFILILYTALNFNMLTRRPISSTRPNKENQNLHVAIYSTVIVLLFLICTFPYTILLMENTYTPTVPRYAFYLYILQLVFDPILYFLFHYLRARKLFKSLYITTKENKRNQIKQLAPIE